MQQSHRARELILARRSVSSMAIAMALVFTVACEDNDGVPTQGGWGGAGASSAGASSAGASSAGASGAGASGAGAVQGGASGAAIAGSPSSSAGEGGSVEIADNGGSGEVAGSTGVAGSAGSGGAAGSTSGAAGSAGSSGFAGSAGSGGSGPATHCAAGGALFVVGNYADTAGNQIILRAAPKAASFALVPAGVANPAKPPQLFLVNRVCAPGGALIASDGSSNYRVDFVQSGDQLAVCLSTAVSTLDAALALPSADASHATSTGCAGHAFTVYTTGSL